MKTSVRASFELTEESALKNATFYSENNSDFCTISKLRTNISEYVPFMTLEHNINVLDGTLETFNSSSYDLSYFSTNLSDENCVSTNEIVVSLAETYSIYGITFDFGNIDFLDQISVDYMKDSEIIKSYDLYPNSRYYTSDIYSNLSYSVSENLTTPLFGTIPYGDYKKVIQAIAFCSCASVNDTRDGVIKVSRIIENESSSEINLNNILGEIKVSLIESPSVVELHYTKYEYHDKTEDGKYKELTTLNLTKGVKTKITSSKPIEYVRYKKTSSSQWTYLSDTAYNLYYFDFTPAETATYTFQIIEMESDNSGLHIFDISEKTNQVENVVKIDSDPLIFHGVDDNGNDNEFIENIKKYYENVPYMVEFEFINNGTIKTGDVVTVETDLGYKIKGYLIEQNISLSGGMISKAKVIGDVVVNDGV